MEIKKIRKALMLFVGLLMPFFVVSCYNRLDDETAESDIPLQFTSKILPASTRMTGEEFEENDKIGVFLLRNNESLSSAFICNEAFVSNSAGLFHAEGELFYPQKAKELQVLSYYPYSKNTLDKESSSLKISVASEQADVNKSAQNDFLFAVKNQVRADYKPLALDFKHLLTKVRIRLKPSEGYTTAQLLQVQPALSFVNFPTQFKYDALQSQFFDYSSYATITPSTDWKIENDGLVGCEAIILPQSDFQSNQKILIEAEGVMYECLLPPELIFESGTISNVTIVYNPSKGVEWLESSSSISKWEDGSSSEVIASEIKSALPISALKFNESSVLDLVSASGRVAAIACEEYLNSEQVQLKAVVVYPVLEGSVQLDSGVILSVDSADKSVVGMTISWDKEKNSFVCTSNLLSSISYLFIDQAGKLCFEEPVMKQNIRVEPHRIVDKRADEVQLYPLQKVGTQLWMKTNLNAAYNVAGAAFASNGTEATFNAGYSISRNFEGVKLYNFAALESGQLAPLSWHIPQTKDWQQLLDYVSLDVNTLKGLSHKVGWSTESGLNLSGLTINQDGVYKEDIWAGLSTVFLIMEGGKTSVFLLQSHGYPSGDYEFRECEKVYQGSVRCVQYF